MAYVRYHRNSFSRSFRKGVVALIFLTLALSFHHASQAQPEEKKDAQTVSQLEAQRLRNEVSKLELEITKLQQETARLQERHSNWTDWMPFVVTFITALLGIYGSFRVARWTRAGALDQATHQKRLDSYPQLIKATAPLALYFPGRGPLGKSQLSREECGAIGRVMSGWYFDGGGLLMSTEARDAYFALARALTRASRLEGLHVPQYPNDADHISKEKVEQYRKKLQPAMGSGLECVDDWTFAADLSEQEKQDELPYARFRDYVFLQELSSQLRTRLATDLSSRRLPT